MEDLYSVKSFPLSCKVNQLDSLCLERMYHDVIVQQVAGTLEKAKLAVKLALYTLHLYCTLWSSNNTPGNALFNLKFMKSSAAQKGTHFLLEMLSICMDYLRERGNPIFSVWVVGSFLNLVAFFVSGKYRTLAERLAGLKLVSFT